MDDVQRALAAAWRKIRPRLQRDPDELRRRLARRRQALLQSPPRAWCLAIRAADTRLCDETRVNLTDAELPASFVQHSSFGIQHSPHSLTLDSADLRDLCAPVELLAPGEPLAVVADRLGTTPHGLLNARVKQRFHTHHVGALNGHWGKPHPMLYTPGELDPSSRGFPAPDPLFSITAKTIGSRIPDSIRATLTRVPIFHDATRDYRDKENLHPEHPAVDRTFDTRRKKRNQKLPPPEPDPVPYKWKGDVFVGYDWRPALTNPLIKQNYERHQRRNQLQSAADKKRRRENPPPSRAGGSLKFRGWRWLCPCCNRAVNILFYPLARLHLLPGTIPPLPRGEERKLALPHPRNQKFACEKCHKLQRFSRCDPNAWNEIVCYLSAGLLFGREVQRPAWLPKAQRIDRMKDPIATCRLQIENHDRKIPHTPRPTREPSKRRPQIEQKLLAGQSFKQIAKDLGLAYGTILWHAQQVYKHHGVRSLPDLLNKHGHAIPPPPTHEVRRRLLAGQSIAQIMAELGCGKMIIYNQRQQLRKEGIKLRDAREHNRVGGIRAIRRQSTPVQGAVVEK